MRYKTDRKLFGLCKCENGSLLSSAPPFSLSLTSSLHNCPSLSLSHFFLLSFLFLSCPITTLLSLPILFSSALPSSPFIQFYHASSYSFRFPSLTHFPFPFSSSVPFLFPFLAQLLPSNSPFPHYYLFPILLPILSSCSNITSLLPLSPFGVLIIPNLCFSLTIYQYISPSIPSLLLSYLSPPCKLHLSPSSLPSPSIPSPSWFNSSLPSFLLSFPL